VDRSVCDSRCHAGGSFSCSLFHAVHAGDLHCAHLADIHIRNFQENICREYNSLLYRFASLMMPVMKDVYRELHFCIVFNFPVAAFLEPLVHSELLLLWHVVK